MDIQDQIRAKEQELLDLKNQKEKMELVNKGIISILDNNLVTDVLFQTFDVLGTTLTNIRIFFKLNGKEIDVLVSLDHQDRLFSHTEFVTRKVAEAVTQAVFKIISASRTA